MDNIGFRVFTDIKRPDPETIELFRGIPTSCIGDNTNRMYCMESAIRPLNNKPLLGSAFTVKAPMGDNLALHVAMDLAQPGDIIVVDAQGCLDRSMMGEIMLTYAMKRGIAGFIIDGAVRDEDGIRNIDIPLYAKGVTPQGPFKFGPGEINVPIACGKQAILPGDILVGDGDGVAVIRNDENARELAALSRKKMQTEDNMLRDYNAGNIGEEKHDQQYGEKLRAMGAQFH